MAQPVADGLAPAGSGLATWPFPPWEHYRSFRAQPAHDGDHPDLVVETFVVCTEACDSLWPTETVRIGFQVSNLGSKQAEAGAVVRLFTRDHRIENPQWTDVASVTVTEAVAAGRSLEGAWLEVAPEDWGTRQVLQVDGDLGDECDRVNDRVEILLDPCE